MFFPSKKKRLWRACVTQYAGSNAVTDATSNRQQQQPLHQHQHHPRRQTQSHQDYQEHQQRSSRSPQQQQQQHPAVRCLENVCCCCNLNSSSGSNSSSDCCCHNHPHHQHQQQQQQQPRRRRLSTNRSQDTPPPPYTHSNNFSEERVEYPSGYIIESHVELEVDSESDNAMTTSEQEAADSSTNGCCYGSYGGNLVVDDYDRTAVLRSRATTTTMTNSCQQQQNQLQPPHFRRDVNITSAAATPTSSPPTPPITMTMASAVAATAANVFRNCCGGGCMTAADCSTGGNSRINHHHSTANSYHHINSNATQLTNNNNNNNHENYTCYEQRTIIDANRFGSIPAPSYIPSQVNNDPKDMFTALMKMLKAHQRATLLQAVENGYASSNNGRQPDCVLVQRGPILGEEPNVIACRLWFWADLKNSSELKRFPSCPNEKDRVYVCCNPTHWSRMLIPETAPPPYQHSAMDRLKPEDRAPSENLKKGENSITTTSINSSSSLQSGLRVQIPESFTTDGEDHSTAPLIWCQVAYWELAQRVGDRYLAKNSSINIYSEGPRGNSGSGSSCSSGVDSNGMCLKDLVDKKSTASPESVQKTRQKIGLGVTLSQEADGVWLFNRSAAPIFVHSPTLNDYDCWFHVSKVPPGYCLKAFDNHRARTQPLVCPPQIAGAQTGPVDTFSMRISFAKGWGPKYCRQDITACPCWLEVLFTRR